MEIYTQVPDKAVGDALKRLSDQLDADHDDGPRRQLDQADEIIDSGPPPEDTEEGEED